MILKTGYKPEYDQYNEGPGHDHRTFLLGREFITAVRTYLLTGLRLQGTGGTFAHFFSGSKHNVTR